MFYSLEWVISELRHALLSCLCATALLLTMGCERQIAPPLVEVTELAPREVESGERLEVHGAGFPQGRSARVSFEGTLFRPGDAPSRGVSIESEGMVVTPDRLEIVVRDLLAERFCGRGDAATHATFRGEVHVSFASSTPGAPPLVGTLHDASVDVLPSSVRSSVHDARIAEGGRVLAYLGVMPGPPSPRGIPIEQVRAGSLAERTGLRVGDVLVSLDGVHVLSLADVVPASSRAAELTIRHPDSGAEETKTVSLSAYAGERIPSEYAPALLVVGLAFALLVLLVLPGPPSLAALELRIAARVRGMTMRAFVALLVGRGRMAALSVLVSAVIAAFALAAYVVGRELDGVMLLASASSLLVWSRVALERGALASLRTLVRLATAALAMAAAIVVGIGQVGAIELAEIVRIQGGAPWQFTAARHPACAILVVVYALAIVSLLRTRSGGVLPARLVDPVPAAPASPPAHAALLERAGVLLASALGVTTFLGGWQLPGLVEPKTRLLLVVSAALFVLKTWLFAGLVLGASRLVSSYRPRDVVAVVLKRL
ncbi:MAG TPA: PDZ domain-containing protein, partial [Labilithrix sp.]|nr:PDZ domain-containing protein [Labilithrix sp.]